MNTRPSNANTHPGAILAPNRRRRSKAEVADERRRNAEMSASQAKQQQVQLRKLASMERHLAQAEGGPSLSNTTTVSTSTDTKRKAAKMTVSRADVEAIKEGMETKKNLKRPVATYAGGYV